MVNICSSSSETLIDFIGMGGDYYGVADQVFRFKLIINSDRIDQSFRLC